MKNVISELKMYGKNFILEVGDVFFKEGSKDEDWYYEPKGKNITLLPKGEIFFRRTSIPCTKQYNEVLHKATNLKQIGESHKYMVTHVNEVVVEEPDLGELYYVGIGLKGGSFSGGKRDCIFDIKSSKITKRTKKQIKVKDLVYRTAFSSSEINKVETKCRFSSNFVEYKDDYAAICDMEHLDEIRDELHKRMKNKIENELKNAQQNLENFTILSKKEGY